MWNIGYCYSEWLRSMVIYIHIAIVSRMSNLVEQKNLSRTPTIMVTSHHFRSCHHLLLQKQGGKSSLCQVTLTHTHTHTLWEEVPFHHINQKSIVFQIYTPWKITMEPKNHRIKKEYHRPNFIIFHHCVVSHAWNICLHSPKIQAKRSKYFIHGTSGYVPVLSRVRSFWHLALLVGQGIISPMIQ